MSMGLGRLRRRPGRDVSRERRIGSVTIHGLPRMSRKGHKAIANWLRGVAETVETSGGNCCERFRSGYIIAVKK